MPSFPLVVEHVADNQQDQEKMILSLDLVLMAKVRALWEEWLTTGMIVESAGFYRWMDDPHGDSTDSEELPSQEDRQED